MAHPVALDAIHVNVGDEVYSVTPPIGYDRLGAVGHTVSILFTHVLQIEIFPAESTTYHVCTPVEVTDNVEGVAL